MVFEIGSHLVAPADTKIAIFLLQASMCCWDDRHLPSYPGVKAFALTYCTSNYGFTINQLRMTCVLALIVIESLENVLIEELTIEE